MSPPTATPVEETPMTVPNPNMYNNVDPTTVRAISWGR